MTFIERIKERLDSKDKNYSKIVAELDSVRSGESFKITRSSSNININSLIDDCNELGNAIRKMSNNSGRYGLFLTESYGEHYLEVVVA